MDIKDIIDIALEKGFFLFRLKKRPETNLKALKFIPFKNYLV